MQKPLNFTGGVSMPNIKLLGSLTWEKIKSKSKTLIMIIPFEDNKQNIFIGLVNEFPEHHILIQEAGLHFSNIDKFFRIILDNESATWTCVCPKDYKGIRDLIKMSERYYNDGMAAISNAITRLGYQKTISIPDRYLRAIDALYK